MNIIEEVLYTGKTKTVGGGRDGVSRSDDGELDIPLASVGSRAKGTNPEQLLGSAWAACYISALHYAAREQGVKLQQGAIVDAEVDLGRTGTEFFLQARLDVHIPEVDLPTAQKLVERAHQTCPYSKALLKSIGVVTRVI